MFFARIINQKFDLKPIDLAENADKWYNNWEFCFRLFSHRPNEKWQPQRVKKTHTQQREKKSNRIGNERILNAYVSFMMCAFCYKYIVFFCRMQINFSVCKIEFHIHLRCFTFNAKNERMKNVCKYNRWAGI